MIAYGSRNIGEFYPGHLRLSIHMKSQLSIADGYCSATVLLTLLEGLLGQPDDATEVVVLVREL